MSRLPISFSAIVDKVDDPVIVTEAEPLSEPGPRIVYVNAAFTRVSGYQAQEVLGKTPRILQGPGTAEETRRKIRAALHNAEPVRTEILNYTKSGEKYWLDLNIMPLRNADGQLTHFVAIERDLTEHIRTRQELHQLATHDNLTGLFNRYHFMELARRAFSLSSRYGREMALAIFDLDNFKRINDAYGYQAGDEVLKILAERCLPHLRGSDTIGRVGGEEFALLLPETDLDQACLLAERLRGELDQHHADTSSGSVDFSASFGVAARSNTDASLGNLLQRADGNLHKAKREGRNRVCGL